MIKLLIYILKQFETACYNKRSWLFCCKTSWGKTECKHNDFKQDSKTKLENTKPQGLKDKPYGSIVDCIQVDTWSNSCNRKQSWCTLQTWATNVPSLPSYTPCWSALALQNADAVSSPAAGVMEHCDHVSVCVMKPCTQKNNHSCAAAVRLAAIGTFCARTCSQLDRVQFGEHAFVAMKHLQNKQPLLLLQPVNLRFSLFKMMRVRSYVCLTWSYYRSVWTGRHQKRFRIVIIVASSLHFTRLDPLRYWLRLWFHNPVVLNPQTKWFGGNVVSACPHCQRFVKQWGTCWIFLLLLWFLFEKIKQGQPNKIWQSRQLASLILADCSRTAFKCSSHCSLPKASQSMLFFYLFFSLQPNPGEHRRNILYISKRHPSFSCWGQSNSTNPRNRAWTSRKCSSACSFVSSSWGRSPKDNAWHNFETCTVFSFMQIPSVVVCAGGLAVHLIQDLLNFFPPGCQFLCILCLNQQKAKVCSQQLVNRLFSWFFNLQIS